MQEMEYTIHLLLEFNMLTNGGIFYKDTLEKIKLKIKCKRKKNKNFSQKRSQMLHLKQLQSKKGEFQVEQLKLRKKLSKKNRLIKNKKFNKK